MHIAHFTNTYHPVISGVVHSVSAFRQALTELGHNVFVFAQDAGDYQDKEPFIFRYPAIKVRFPVEFPAIIPISPTIDTLLPALKLDVIHTHHPILVGQAAANKANELDLPLVFTFHTQYREYTHYFPIPQEAVQSFVKDAVVNWLGEFMQKCQHIVVPSESMRRNLSELYGLIEDVTVIPTGIDLRPYEKAERSKIREERGWGNERVLISVGRLAREKNWQTLLKASALAMQTHRNLRLALIGDGPQRAELEKLAHQSGIGDKVEFIGKLPFSKVPRYLKAADLFGFASVTETQGLVTMEALAAGLPVVAVEATGTSDVIEHGKQGLLTRNDPESLGQAIIQILQNEERAAHFRQAALQKAREFDIFIHAKTLVNVYGQAIEAKKAGHYVKVPRHNKLFYNVIEG